MKCEQCSHEMTEAGEDSACEKVGVCFLCLGFVAGLKHKHTQADHDDDAVCNGMMEKELWEKRNPDRRFNEHFKESK
jgi:hypothetical protein